MSDEAQVADEERGLYYKFRIQHGQSKIQGDDMFVLDLMHDEYASAAVSAYYNYGPPVYNEAPAQDLYLVTRLEGDAVKHKDCTYHVLNFSRNHERSMAAIKQYVQDCREKYPNLATDLWAKYIQPEEAGW